MAVTDAAAGSACFEGLRSSPRERSARKWHIKCDSMRLGRDLLNDECPMVQRGGGMEFIRAM